MQRCHWCHHQHYVIPMAMLMALHDQRGHVAPHFNCLDLRNSILLVKMPLASCDTDADTNSITWPKKSFCISDWLSEYKECNGTIANTVSIMWCWCWYQWHHITTKVILAPHFNDLDLLNAVVPMNDATDIMWCWCQYKWHHIKSNICSNIMLGCVALYQW